MNTNYYTLSLKMWQDSLNLWKSGIDLQLAMMTSFWPGMRDNAEVAEAMREATAASTELVESAMQSMRENAEAGTLSQPKARVHSTPV